MLHDHEGFFIDGKRVEPAFEPGSSGFAPADVAAYEKEGQVLLIFLNLHDDEMKVSFVLKNPFRYARAREFHTGQSFVPSGNVSISIPPGRIAALHFE